MKNTRATQATRGANSANANVQDELYMLWEGPELAEKGEIEQVDFSHPDRERGEYFTQMEAPSLKATLFRSDNFLRDFPVLAKMKQRTCEHYADEVIDEGARIIVVEQKALPELYSIPNFSSVSSRGVLVFFLPRRFERFAAELAVAKPFVWNTHTLDLMRCYTRCSWEAFVERESVVVSICDVAVDKAIHHNIEPSRLDESMGVFTPTIVVSGDTVACGGFWHDVVDSEGHHVASFTAINYKPWNIYSEEELSEAQGRSAAEMEKPVQTHDNAGFIDLPSFDCTNWPESVDTDNWTNEEP